VASKRIRRNVTQSTVQKGDAVSGLAESGWENTLRCPRLGGFSGQLVFVKSKECVGRNGPRLEFAAHRFNASAFTNNSAGADSKYRNKAGHNQPSIGG